MRITSLLVAAIASLGLGAMPAAVAAQYQAIPIEALSRLPAIQNVSMSPDGKYLVGLIPSPKDPDETALATWDMARMPGPPSVVTPSGATGDMQFIGAFALKAGKIFVVARQQWEGNLGGCGEGKVSGSTKTFVTKTYLTGMQQKDFAPAFASDKHNLEMGRDMQTCLAIQGGTARPVAGLPLDPDNIIIRRATGTALVTTYFRYDLSTGKATMLFQGSPRTEPELFDRRTGQLLAEVSFPTGDEEIQTLIRDPRTGKMVLQKPLTVQVAARYEMRVIGVDDSSGKYYVLTNRFSNLAEVWMYDAATQKFDPQPALAAKEYPIDGLVFGDQPVNFNKVVGYTVGGPAIETVYIAPELKVIQTSLEQDFPGQQIRVLQYTNDFSKVLFQTQNNSHPTAWYLLLDGKKIAGVGSKRPWIKPDEIGAESWVTYTARDGTPIHAILDLPVGWKKGDAPLPAVVMPHGGPWDRDYMGWGIDGDSPGWVPLLTSRGYAVLRPQFRGSTGFGRDFWLAGDNQWGLKMSDDVDDGAHWLVHQGIAAKDKIAVYGYSYGGFVAAAAVVRSPSPYQCAISGAPVTALATLKTTWGSNRMNRILQAHTITGMDPMENTDKAHLPVLLFDGTRDVRAPGATHAHPFYEAVKGRVPAEFQWIPDMSHSLPWYPSQEKQVDALIVNFLASSNCHMATAENPGSTH